MAAHLANGDLAASRFNEEDDDDDDEEDQLAEDEFLEIPSCLESLANSACQLRQLATHADLYYSKLFLSYGHACESSWKNLDGLNDLRGGGGGGGAPNDSSLGSNSLRTNPAQKPLGASLAHDLNQLAGDKASLEKLAATTRLLPLLEELSSFIDRCSACIESTVRRATYYLNQPNQNAKDGAFRLTGEARIDTIFVALMDLMFALVKLDVILTDHTSIKQNVELFLAACKLAASSSGRDGVANLPGKDEINRLVEHVGAINLTLCPAGNNNNNGSALLGQTLCQVQHLYLILSKDKTSLGFKRLGQLLESYLLFLTEHRIGVEFSAHLESDLESDKTAKATKTAAHVLINLNLVPTLHMHHASHRTLGLACLGILYSSLFKATDRKVVKAINQSLQRARVQNVIPLETLNSHVLLDSFLRAHAPKQLIEGRTYDQLSKASEQPELKPEVEFERLVLRATPWLLNLESEALDLALGKMEGWPRKQIGLIDRGVRLAEEISTTISNINLVQCHQKRAPAKSNQIGLFKLVALLKAIECAFEQHEAFVSTCLVRAEQLARSKWRQALMRLQRRQISLKFSDRQLDLNSLLLLSSIGARPELIGSGRGRDTQAICLSMLLSSLSPDELQDLSQALDLLRLDNRPRLSQATNCNQLYWHLSALGAYYNHAFEEFPSAIEEMHYVHLALDDMRGLFEPAHKPAWSSSSADGWILEKLNDFLNEMAAELLDQFKCDFVDRVCQEFEVELRLQTHRDLYNEEHNNPFRRHLYNFKRMIKQGRESTRFRLFNHSLDLNNLIEQHLNKVCYNLTSIAPHDWFTYDSMMNLARHKFKLSFVDGQLPAQTLDFGLDLLDITRNLSLFAARYSYDLTNQLFIEKCSARSSNASALGANSMLSSYAASSSSSQSLNVIQSKHVAQSIQAHGYGVLDSTINCTYQTLKRLVGLFARQLADDRLRATLQREHQQFVNDWARAQPKLGATMSFERANRMAKQFKLTAATLSDSNRPAGIDLDSIRQTITQLGNLLAFIRLIKSGALDCVSKSVDYLPELEELASFRLEGCAEREFADFQLQAPLLAAAKNLDQCLSDFQVNFSPKTNYLRIIVSLFTSLLSPNKPQPPEQRQEGAPAEAGDQSGVEESKPPASPPSEDCDKREHLKLFFLLIPALIINYIDYLINCKERASSRSSSARFGALLSDDGFALGVAFLLTALSQVGEHNKLDWLRHTSAKLRDDIGALAKRSAEPRQEESLRQTSIMTIKRLNRLLAEYVAFDQTLNCALLLFSACD